MFKSELSLRVEIPFLATFFLTTLSKTRGNIFLSLISRQQKFQRCRVSTSCRAGVHSGGGGGGFGGLRPPDLKIMYPPINFALQKYLEKKREIVQVLKRIGGNKDPWQMYT